MAKKTQAVSTTGAQEPFDMNLFKKTMNQAVLALAHRDPAKAALGFGEVLNKLKPQDRMRFVRTLGRHIIVTANLSFILDKGDHHEATVILLSVDSVGNVGFMQMGADEAVRHGKDIIATAQRATKQAKAMKKKEGK